MHTSRLVRLESESPEFSISLMTMALNSSDTNEYDISMNFPSLQPKNLRVASGWEPGSVKRISLTIVGDLEVRSFFKAMSELARLLPGPAAK